MKAFPLGKLRIIGDIGIRAFFQLYKKAKQIIKNERIDFLYITIPSFYVSLLGRWLHATTGIKYGIDYIDPWVHDFPGSNKLLSRHWFSTKLADLLEPIAVKKASLITGVAEGYYAEVLRRNQVLNQRISGAMPYGGEAMDYSIVKSLHNAAYLFNKEPLKIKLVYAGAMLPKAFGPLEKVFESIAANRAAFSETEFHFIGTGKTPGDAKGFNIKPLAQKYGLWQKVIFEYPQRISYANVLVHLNIADGIFILGSTEPHYTPSKVYQAVLSGKAVFGVLHKESTAALVIERSGTGIVLTFDENTQEKIKDQFAITFQKFLAMVSGYNVDKTDKAAFENYSAKNVTKKLAALLEDALAIEM